MRALTWELALLVVALLGGPGVALCQAQAAGPDSSISARPCGDTTESACPTEAADDSSVAAAGPSANSFPTYFWHVDSAPSGIELVTLFAEFPQPGDTQGGPDRVPLVSLLRDTLGDADESNDRLDYLWLLTYTRPTKTQRFFSAIPFFYRRVSAGRETPDPGVPKPLVNLAHSKNRVWTRMGGTVVQWAAFDPQSMPVRTVTRSYRTNDLNADRLHVEEAIHFLRLAPTAEYGQPITPEQRDAVMARLALAKNTLGGLVEEEHLNRLHDSHQADWEAARARNWELLRNSAERAGLYFEPMQLDGQPDQFAVVWFPLDKTFDASGVSLKKTWKLLQVKDPWNDPRLNDWQGYRQLRSFDAEGALLPRAEAGASEGYVAPLAVYSLTYSRQPLLLADFRSHLNTKWREIFQRSWVDLATGVFALSHFTNWYYYVGTASYEFLRSRSGSATNSAERLDSYADLRSSLALDQTLDPEFRKELEQRLGDLSINPLESSPGREANLARLQYAELLKAANQPELLPKRVENERREEMAAFGATTGANVRSGFAHYLTLGVYKRRAPQTPEYLATLDRQRRINASLKFLSRVADAGPSPEVVFGETRIQDSIDALSMATDAGTPAPIRQRATVLLARVKSNSNNETLRANCDRLLEALRSGQYEEQVARNLGAAQKPPAAEDRMVSIQNTGAQ